MSPDGASASATTAEGDASEPVQPSSRSQLKHSRHAQKRMPAHKAVKSAAEKVQKKAAAAPEKLEIAQEAPEGLVNKHFHLFVIILICSFFSLLGACAVFFHEMP